jgi:hypothetical protein
MGISTVNPAVMLVAIVFNDAFQIIAGTSMAVLCILLAIVAYITNWWGNRNMKTTIGLVAMGVGVLMYFGSTGAITYSNDTYNWGNGTSSSIGNIQQNMVNMYDSGWNWYTMATEIPVIIYNFLTLILNLPTLIVSLIGGLLFTLNPMIGTAFLNFSGILILGAYFFIGIKAYEFLANKFQPV